MQESRKDWLLKLFRQFAAGNKQYGNYPIWDYTDHPVALFSNSVIEQKMHYVEQNPVRVGLVTEAQFYKYSSACFDSPLKVLDI